MNECQTADECTQTVWCASNAKCFKRTSAHKTQGDQDWRGAFAGATGSVRWFVCHQDAEALGLDVPEFSSKELASAAADKWNKEIPGHYIVGIKSAPNNQIARAEKEPPPSH